LLQSSKLAAERTWPRAAGLLLVTLMLAVSSGGVLVAFPFLLLTMVLGLGRLSAAVATVLAVIVAVGVPVPEGVWYLERAWAVVLAGWFVVLTMQWPESRFFPRALGAVGATGAVVGLLLVVQPGTWSMVSWVITDGMMRSVSLMDQMVIALDPEAPISVSDLNWAFEATAMRGRLFPALLGLSSLSGLAVAWWAYMRLAAGSRLGLGPLRDFRFNDNLVWLLLVGLALIVLGVGEGWTSAGGNAVMFMGGLYALRGAAVLLFLNGGVTGLGILFFVVGSLVLGRVLIMGVLMGTLLVGVGDTWLDLRARAEAISASKS
jgi:hypothetical protein